MQTRQRIYRTLAVLLVAVSAAFVAPRWPALTTASVPEEDSACGSTVATRACSTTLM